MQSINKGHLFAAVGAAAGQMLLVLLTITQMGSVGLLVDPAAVRRLASSLSESQ